MKDIFLSLSISVFDQMRFLLLLSFNEYRLFNFIQEKYLSSLQGPRPTARRITVNIFSTTQRFSERKILVSSSFSLLYIFFGGDCRFTRRIFIFYRSHAIKKFLLSTALHRLLIISLLIFFFFFSLWLFVSRSSYRTLNSEKYRVAQLFFFSLPTVAALNICKIIILLFPTRGVSVSCQHLQKYDKWFVPNPLSSIKASPLRRRRWIHLWKMRSHKRPSREVKGSQNIFGMSKVELCEVVSSSVEKNCDESKLTWREWKIVGGMAECLRNSCCHDFHFFFFSLFDTVSHSRWWSVSQFRSSWASCHSNHRSSDKDAGWLSLPHIARVISSSVTFYTLSLCHARRMNVRDISVCRVASQYKLITWGNCVGSPR